MASARTWMLPPSSTPFDPNGWKLRVLRRLRYDDIGDWDDQRREIRVLDAALLSEPKLRGMDTHVVNTAILLHEFVEMVLCKQVGLDGWKVDRLESTGKGTMAPGLNRAHRFAVRIERELIRKMGADWG